MIYTEQKFDSSNKHILFDPSNIIMGKKCVISVDEKSSANKQAKKLTIHSRRNTGS